MFFEADQIDALRDFQHKLYEVSGMAWDRQKEDVWKRRPLMVFLNQ